MSGVGSDKISIEVFAFLEPVVVVISDSSTKATSSNEG